MATPTHARWKTILLSLALLAVFGGAFAAGRARRAEPSRTVATSASNGDTTWAVPDPGTPKHAVQGTTRLVAITRDAAAAGEPRIPPRAALTTALASDDVAVRIAGIEAAVGSTATETLDDLEAVRIEKDPDAAPTVIHAIALLGASAEGRERERAAGTLSRWLGQESKREGADAVGNVSNLVEALGDLGGNGAVDALVAALDAGGLALFVETVAVQKLGELRDARARGAVERFASRVLAMPKSEEAFDEELRQEALTAARETLAKL